MKCEEEGEGGEGAGGGGQRGGDSGERERGVTALR